MTWYSMMDLGVHYLSLPVWLSVGVSLAFDGGAVYLGLLSILYAKTSDSGVLTELGAFAFIGTGVYGIVMFASAPIIVGIMLKVTLNFLTRQARKAAGRITEKLPSVGVLTWLRYAPQSFKLMSVAMQGRLINAADKLDIVPDRHQIFGQTKDKVSDKQEIVRVVSEVSGQNQDNRRTAEELSEDTVLPALTTSDKLSLPVWLPQEPTISLSKLSRTCMDNGVFDTETIYRYALVLKGQDVNKMSLSRTVAREKTKLS
jgi:hypothetical protein